MAPKKICGYCGTVDAQFWARITLPNLCEVCQQRARAALKLVRAPPLGQAFDEGDPHNPCPLCGSDHLYENGHWVDGEHEYHCPDCLFTTVTNHGVITMIIRQRIPGGEP